MLSTVPRERIPHLIRTSRNSVHGMMFIFKTSRYLSRHSFARSSSSFDVRWIKVVSSVLIRDIAVNIYAIDQFVDIDPRQSYNVQKRKSALVRYFNALLLINFNACCMPIWHTKAVTNILIVLKVTVAWVFFLVAKQLMIRYGCALRCNLPDHLKSF